MENFIIIIGAMKCGTTSLFRYLSQHPQISACKNKEPDFFTNDRNWAKGFEWYQSLWHCDNPNHRIALEASTNYTKMPAFPNAAERIATLNAHFRFIYIMRNPIDRIESHYKHGRVHGEFMEPIQDVLPYLIDVSRYAAQIEEYYKRFPEENIYLLNFNDLILDPLRWVGEICKFLKINSSFEFQELNKVHNPFKSGSINHPVWDVLKRMRLLRLVTNIVPTRFKNGIRTPLALKFEHDIGLKIQQRSFVQRELRDDLFKLNEEYGFNVSRWNPPTI